MSAYDSPVRKRTDRRGIDSQSAQAHDTPDAVPDGALCIGVDGTGGRHFFHHARRVVYCVDDGELTNQTPLANVDGGLRAYADNVAAERGDWLAYKVV